MIDGIKSCYVNYEVYALVVLDEKVYFGYNLRIKTEKRGVEMRKYGYWMICSAILFAILLWGFLSTDLYAANKYPLEFAVEQDSYDAKISIHESDESTCYVFLPSYAELAELKIVMPVDLEVTLGGIPITNGMNCEAFDLETSYALTVDKQYIAELQFYQSANVATLYVDTALASMDRIHRDKNYSEQASVMLYTAEGVMDLSDSTAYIKGRGNATWTDYAKRPYILTLSVAADLLGMGEATKWILLANAADTTNLKNKLIFDLARQTGSGWVPDCEFVDVYLNGEYSGLYLLTEKLEVAPSRLNLDPQSGDFLCKFDLEERWTSLKDPIKTQIGRTVEICSPDSLTESSRTDIVSAINQMEQIIMSGSDLAETENFDLDSWVQRYLIDEISGNIDSDLASSYFYFWDGVFYAGPVWDYDMTFGNNPRNRYSTAFVAKITYKTDEFISPYYSVLYANKSFYNRMVEYYQAEFLPLLNQLIDNGISDRAAEIEAAAKMNQLRYDSDADVESDVDGLISYLKSRVSFLNSAWLENTEYCTLQFEPADEIQRSFSVRMGELLVTDDVDLKNTTWVDKDTGNVVDFRQPILSDMRLEQQGGRGITIDRKSLKVYVTVLCIVIFLAFFVCVVYVDILQRSKERRAANESRKTHVSP